MAPELALGPLEVGPAVDIFAFGILAYEVLLGRGPFEDDPLSIRVSGRALPRPPPLPVTHHRLQPEAALLIERCILEAPTQRPSADELVSVFSRIGVGVPSAKTVGTA
jgi:serine/threonine-protein kinase